MSEARDRAHDRIRWHCRRGMLELDLVLNAYVERHLDGLDANELEVFQAVLAYPDPMLFALVMGRAEPEDDAERGIIAQLRAINANVAA
ncbi:MAG TPA: succinate dehydrogenase assembly factor 2 [Burkholderiales bacterium]|nr:succinate dehydrogenase assembly factor 2 [Burkholderiales bacterium]